MTVAVCPIRLGFELVQERHDAAVAALNHRCAVLLDAVLPPPLTAGRIALSLMDAVNAQTDRERFPENEQPFKVLKQRLRFAQRIDTRPLFPDISLRSLEKLPQCFEKRVEYHDTATRCRPQVRASNVVQRAGPGVRRECVPAAGQAGDASRRL